MKYNSLVPKRDFHVKVNIRGDEIYWHRLFQELMEQDVMAPMLIMTGYLNAMMISDCPVLASPYAEGYAWIGDLMADPEREAIASAAEMTGLFAQGLCDFVMFVVSSRERKKVYNDLMEEILADQYLAALLPTQIFDLYEQ